MKIAYVRETDSLYIDFSTKPSVESDEIRPGIVLDFDEDGNLVGIDIDRGSQKLDLSQLEIGAITLTGAISVPTPS